MKKTLWLLLFLPLIAGGCFNFIQRKALPDARFTQETMIDEAKRLHNQRRMVKIHTPTQVYDLANSAFDGDFLTGVTKADDLEYMPPSDKKMFARSYLPRSMRFSFIRYIHIYTSVPLPPGEVSLPVGNVDSVVYYRGMAGLNTLLNVTTAVVVPTVAVSVFLAIVCNCPKVHAIVGNDTLPEGSVLSGATMPTLEREAWLMLRAKEQPGQDLSIMIRNELPEHHYLDELSLWKGRLEPGYEAAYLTDGSLTSFKGLVAPQKAHSGDDKDLLPAFSLPDERFFDFSNQPEPEALNALYLTFDKHSLGDAPHLDLRARQSEWLMQVAEFTFQQFGNELDDWFKRMEKIPPGIYERNLADRGISLRASILTDKGWKEIGVFRNAMQARFFSWVLPLDLKGVKGDQVQIKLESAHRFWEIDQAAVALSVKPLLSLEKAALSKAENQDGSDVLATVNEVDGVYHEQPVTGNFVQISTSEARNHTDEFWVLRATGYYRPVHDYAHGPNREVIRALKKGGKASTQELSLILSQTLQMAQN